MRGCLCSRNHSSHLQTKNLDHYQYYKEVPRFHYYRCSYESQSESHLLGKNPLNQMQQVCHCDSPLFHDRPEPQIHEEKSLESSKSSLNNPDSSTSTNKFYSYHHNYKRNWFLFSRKKIRAMFRFILPGCLTYHSYCLYRTLA